MASADVESFKPVLVALSTMQSNVERAQKSQAHEYLETFQKSVSTALQTHGLSCADHTCAVARSMENHPLHTVSIRYPTRTKIICGNNTERQSTLPPLLRGAIPQCSYFQITYDLDQLPRQSLPGLRDSILTLLTAYSEGPRPIRTQLCVSLANLAIQMTEWKDVLQVVGSRLGNSGGDCVLELLRVLPEEVTEGRKINLSVCRVETPSACRQTPSTLRARDISI